MPPAAKSKLEVRGKPFRAVWVEVIQLCWRPEHSNSRMRAPPCPLRLHKVAPRDGTYHKDINYRPCLDGKITGHVGCAQSEAVSTTQSAEGSFVLSRGFRGEAQGPQPLFNHCSFISSTLKSQVEGLAPWLGAIVTLSRCVCQLWCVPCVNDWCGLLWCAPLAANSIGFAVAMPCIVHCVCSAGSMFRQL
jgi:hypothetical protein